MIQRIDPDYLLELEKQISSCSFLDCGLGPALNDFNVIQLLNANYKKSLTGLFKSISELIYRLLIFMVSCFRRVSIKESSGEKSKILVTWINKRANLSKLILPLIEELNEAEVTVIGNSPNMVSELSPDVEFITAKSIQKNYPVTGFFQLCKCLLNWGIVINRFCRNQKLPSEIIFIMLTNLVANAFKLSVFKSYLKKNIPRAIVTEYDRNTFSVSLIIAASNLNIPSYTFMHGVINSKYGFTPLVADYIFAWGQLSKEKLIQYGVSENRILKSGYHIVDLESSGSKLNARKKAGISSDKIVIELATNPLQHINRRKIVEIFCQTMAELTNYTAVVRLHPSEFLEFYQREIYKYPDVIFHTNDFWTMEESIAGSDIVVCHNSGYALEALIRGIPVVILDVIDQPLSSAQEYVDKAGCPVAKSKEELKIVLSKLVVDRVFRDHTIQAAEKFIAETYEYTGKEALKKVCMFIREGQLDV